MFDTCQKSRQSLNRAEYRDKVLGCWTGKNIGGTLGAPIEGRREMFDLTFYKQDLNGTPAPNDDLDLQLVWLQAAEERGVYQLNERVLGEYWMAHITGPWNEYGIGKANMANGFQPPLSGALNNGQWKNSNGAWIRSEIWACLFPGSPDDVLEFAWYDSCVDHAGDGIYAELFTAALESAAFVVQDIRRLIEIALSKIPADCRVARSVKLACREYDAGRSLADARNAIVADSNDLGWFQAPANVAFAILGLLYGEGDFGKSLCCAVNCGDDTDCTGATVGSVLGILLGRSGIPSKWSDPIGESIQTVAINRFRLDVPATISELTDRVVRLAEETARWNPTLPGFTDDGGGFDAGYLAGLDSDKCARKRIWNRSSFAQTYPLPWGEITVTFENEPQIATGESLKMCLSISPLVYDDKVVHLEWGLPEGWSASPGEVFSMLTRMGQTQSIECELTAGTFSGAVEYLPLTIRLAGRFNPLVVMVPIQQKGCANNEFPEVNQSYYDIRDRLLARRRG